MNGAADSQWLGQHLNTGYIFTYTRLKSIERNKQKTEFAHINIRIGYFLAGVSNVIVFLQLPCQQKSEL